MHKKYLFFGLIALSKITMAEQTVTKSDIQTTADNIAIQLQIPKEQRSNFTTEYTNKSIALQDVMQQNISAQDKATKAKVILNQSNQNLKQNTPSTQISKYNSYFNKNTTLTASVTNTKTPTSKSNTTTSTNTSTPNTYTKNAEYNKLPADHQEVVDNMAIQLALDNNQFQKISKDYLSFFNGTESIAKSASGNILKAKKDFDVLVDKTNTSVKAYLSDEQYNQFTTLLKSGKLGKDTTPRVGTSNQSTTVNSNTNTTTSVNNNANLSQIKSANTLAELKKSLGLTDAQYTKALAIAKKYDAEIAAIATSYPNNIDQQKAALDKRTPLYVNQFKSALTATQANTFFGVLVAQVNILTGKNITPEYQALINTMKTKYGMSDVQVMQTMVVLTEAKVKSDANSNLNKNNATVQKQESDKIVAEIDSKLKGILTADQYSKVKTDIISAINKK